MNRERLKKQIKVDEGVVSQVYKDHLGIPTLGVGHKILKTDEEYGEPVGTPVDSDRVNYLLDHDLDFAILDCHILYGEDEFHSWPDEVQEVIANMSFNLGRTNLSKFVKMNAALKNHDWVEAAKEGRDSKWFWQVGQRSERLMTRLENA